MSTKNDQRNLRHLSISRAEAASHRRRSGAVQSSRLNLLEVTFDPALGLLDEKVAWGKFD